MGCYFMNFHVQNVISATMDLWLSTNLFLATLCRRFGKINTANDKMLAPFELALEKCNQCCSNSTISGFQKTFVNYNTPLLYCFDYLTQKTKDKLILGLKIQRTLNVSTVDFEISGTQRNVLENICTVTINNMLVR